MSHYDRALNDAFAAFRACCEDAPTGTYEHAKAVRDLIGSTVDGLLNDLKALGVRPCNSDGAHHVEATIFAWVKGGSGATGQLYTAQGFGDAVRDPDTRERVLAGAVRDRDALVHLQKARDQ